MVKIVEKQKFPMGELLITSSATSSLAGKELIASLARHLCGDWGDVDEDTRNRNEMALRNNERLFSQFRTRQGITFQIITTRGRSATAIMLPEDE